MTTSIRDVVIFLAAGMSAAGKCQIAILNGSPT